jgi:arylsulfatase A-like enzyme
LGLRESTLICYVSDNGFNCGHHGIWGKGNGTFSLNMYDTSVKVPAIFSHPGRIPEGTVSDQLVSGYDVMPTLLEYVGLTMPELAGRAGPVKAPGSSFAGALQGDTSEAANEQVVVYDEYGPVRMVRTRDWKYVHRYPFGPHELYSLKEDPGERTNRIQDTGCGDVIREMRERLEDWFLDHVDPELDGARQPVTGNGQLTPVGRRAKGRLTFDQDRELRTDPRADPGMKR